MSARQIALEAELRSALTKQERRSAVSRFLDAPAPVEPQTQERVKANAQLRAQILGAHQKAKETRESVKFELRAAPDSSPPEGQYDSSNAAGGYLLAPGFSNQAGFPGTVIRYLKQASAMLGAVEVLNVPTGATYKRPQVSAFTAAGSALSEATQITDQSSLVTWVGQQSFGIAPLFPVLLYGSIQLFEDANVDLINLLGSVAGEALNRQMASAVSTAIYATAAAGNEQSITSLTVDNLAKMLAKLDPIHVQRGTARFYVSPADYATLASNDPTGLRNLNDLIGVVPDNSCGNYTASSAVGPVLGALGSHMTMRVVGSLGMQVLRERYADFLQIGVLVTLRGGDFQPTGMAGAAVFAT